MGFMVQASGFTEFTESGLGVVSSLRRWAALGVALRSCPLQGLGFPEKEPLEQAAEVQLV